MKQRQFCFISILPQHQYQHPCIGIADHHSDGNMHAIHAFFLMIFNCNTGGSVREQDCFLIFLMKIIITTIIIIIISIDHIIFGEYTNFCGSMFSITNSIGSETITNCYPGAVLSDKSVRRVQIQWIYAFVEDFVHKISIMEDCNCWRRMLSPGQSTKVIEIGEATFACNGLILRTPWVCTKW